MPKRTAAVITAVFAVLILMLLMSVPVTMAIGEVTPTPAPADAATPVPDTGSTGVPQPPATPSPESEALLDRAIQAIQGGNYQDAVEIMDEAIALQPDVADHYFIRAAAYAQLGELDTAVEDLTTAIDLVPYLWTYYLFRGNIYVGLEDTAAALQDYDRAIELNPRYEEAYANRGDLLERLGDTDEAGIDRLIAEGLARLGRQDFRGAIRRFTDAIEADGGRSRNSANAYYNRALAYSQMDDTEAAIEDYTAALEIYPDMHDAYLGRGIAHVQQENTREAGSDFLRRIEILTEDTLALTLEVGGSTDVMMTYGTVYRITFTGQGGESVAIEARATDESGVDPLIVVLDPAGTPLAGDDDLGGGTAGLDAEIARLRLPADGTYTIVVSHANGGYDGMVRVAVK